VKEIKLSAAPESFQLAMDSPRLYLNAPEANRLRKVQRRRIVSPRARRAYDKWNSCKRPQRDTQISHVRILRSFIGVYSAGRTTEHTVPLPTMLAKSILPPCAVTMLRA
jgi:hypothetical protein